jgi:hypothetical protein
VQKRREVSTRVTQRLQVLIQQRVITRVLGGAGQLSRPLALRLLARFPFMRRLPARLIGVGVRPEHIKLRSNRADHTVRHDLRREMSGAQESGPERRNGDDPGDTTRP